MNADGTVDPTFNPGVGVSYDAAVDSLAVQPDGNILVGGAFYPPGGERRNWIRRVNNTALATQSLSYDGSTISWLRGGTSPEVWRTTFEQSTDGFTWNSMGAGTRIPGGWQVTGVSLPTGGTIRARGHVIPGREGGWFVEKLWRPGPDLCVVSLDTPLEALAASTQPVAWTVVNRGAKPVTNGWVDRVFLSDDAVVPSTPVQDFRLQVKAWQHHFAAIFGFDALARVRGFSPSEMALPNHPDIAYEFVKTLKDCGFG